MNLCEPSSIRLLSISCHTMVTVALEGVATFIWLLNIGQIYIRRIVLPEKLIRFNVPRHRGGVCVRVCVWTFRTSQL